MKIEAHKLLTFLALAAALLFVSLLVASPTATVGFYDYL